MKMVLLMHRETRDVNFFFVSVGQTWRKIFNNNCTCNVSTLFHLRMGRLYVLRTIIDTTGGSKRPTGIYALFTMVVLYFRFYWMKFNNSRCPSW